MPKATRLAQIQPRSKELAEKKKKVWAEISDLKKQAKSREVEIEEHRKKMEGIREE